jgi:hypothetical protein
MGDHQHASTVGRPARAAGVDGWRRSSLVLALALAGCLPQPGFTEPDEAHWIEQPDDVRVLLVPPRPTTRLEAPGLPTVDVAVGAFFARWSPGGDPVDQLALLVVMDGWDAEILTQLADRLLLEIDGTRYVGAPGSSENSLRMERTPAGLRVTMAVPVGLPELTRLIEARDVMAQLGPWGVFGLSRDQRMRFRSLVEKLPAGAPLTLRRTGQLALAAD